MINNNVVTVMDGLTGSCGKGKVIGEIANDVNYNVLAAVTNNMPNAGHTAYIGKEKRVFNNIPVSIINPNTELFIGPNSAFNLESFIDEYERHSDLLGDRKIYVHELVPLISNKHILLEKKIITSGSTHKGCGAVTADKVMRNPNLKFFKGYKNAIVLSNDEWLEKLYQHLDNPNGFVILEGAQGAGLSLNYSGNHPYVTRKDISVSSMLNDSGVHPSRFWENIMVIRPFPIRISNVTYDGSYVDSGNFGKGDLLTWSHINIASLYSSYPTHNMFEVYSDNLSDNMIQSLINSSTEESLLQVLGQNFKAVRTLNLIQALELERLFYKNQGKNSYHSCVINLPNYDNEDDMLIIDYSEDTTVTKKERRIFDLDINKLKQICKINIPDGLYLNFFQHLSDIYTNQQRDFYRGDYPAKAIREYLRWLEDETNSEIRCLGTGAYNHSRLRIKNLITKKD